MTIHAPGDPAAGDRVAVQALAVLAGRARQVTEFLAAQASPGWQQVSEPAWRRACAT